MSETPVSPVAIEAAYAALEKAIGPLMGQFALAVDDYLVGRALIAEVEFDVKVRLRAPTPGFQYAL